MARRRDEPDPRYAEAKPIAPAVSRGSTPNPSWDLVCICFEAQQSSRSEGPDPVGDARVWIVKRAHVWVAGEVRASDESGGRMADRWLIADGRIVVGAMSDRSAIGAMAHRGRGIGVCGG